MRRTYPEGKFLQTLLTIMPFSRKKKLCPAANSGENCSSQGSSSQSRIFPREFPLSLAHCPSLKRRDFLLLWHKTWCAASGGARSARAPLWPQATAGRVGHPLHPSPGVRRVDGTQVPPRRCSEHGSPVPGPRCGAQEGEPCGDPGGAVL